MFSVGIAISSRVQISPLRPYQRKSEVIETSDFSFYTNGLRFFVPLTFALCSSLFRRRQHYLNVHFY
nr:MAG TPA: hypothetical protein [Caudoviricetes sp.]